MSQENENFESLQRLLTLKRHEQPPPGYFHGFSREVIVRIRAGETGEDAYGYVWQLSWLQKIWSAFEARPAFATTLGLAACGLVVFGVLSADGDKVNIQPVGIAAQEEQSSGLRMANYTPSSAGQPAMVQYVEGGQIRPVSASVQPSLFDLVPSAQATPVALNLAAPNN
jgi:hypothetical protein